MADLSITAANVVAASSATVIRGVAAETVTAGKVMARNAAGGFVLADSNSATAATRAAIGIALNGASAGQPLSVISEGALTAGATLTPGTDYWLSDTPGGLCPRADLASGEYPVLVGVATSASVLSVDIRNSGVAL